MKARVKRIPAIAKRLFLYEPDTGYLYWQHRPLSHFKSEHDYNVWNTRFAGTRAGVTNAEGYIVVGIYGTKYLAHRIIPYLMRNWNKTHLAVDHRNGVRSDNRWTNLQPVTQLENARNLGIRSDNQSGHTGVFQCAPGKWKAYLTINRRTLFLGYFRSKASAIKVRVQAEITHYGKYRRACAV